ncbi:MAG: zinc ribbon domain-containing protein [Armatimonadota bacterium]
MTEELRRLYGLQQIDSQIFELEAALAALDDGAATREELAEVEAELARLEEELSKTEGQHRDKELQLGSTEEKRQQNWERAYGGTVSNPKELEGLQMEIEALDRQKDRLEEEIILLLEALDEQSRAVEEQRTRAEELRARGQQVEATFASETERLTGELESLRARRAETLPGIGERTLARYETLLRRAANLAVAEVVEGVCRGCNMAVPTAKVQQLRQLGRALFCDNCKRFLYLDTGD